MHASWVLGLGKCGSDQTCQISKNNEIPVWKDRGIVRVWFRIDFSAHGDRESPPLTQNVRYTTINRKAHLTADTIEHETFCLFRWVYSRLILTLLQDQGDATWERNRSVLWPWGRWGANRSCQVFKQLRFGRLLTAHWSLTHPTRWERFTLLDKNLDFHPTGLQNNTQIGRNLSYRGNVK